MLGLTKENASRPPDHRRSTRAPHLVIRPPGRLPAPNARELWTYRDLLLSFAARDLRLRYRQTALGVVWVVLQPLLGALVFAFVFGRVAGLRSGDVPYFVFAYAGLIGWLTFSGILLRASQSLTAAGAMITKIYFPRVALPLSVLGAVLLDFSVSLLLLLALIGANGIPLSWHVALLPIWLLMVVCLATGLGLASAALAARYRDIQYVVPMLLQLLMFASPVGYGIDAVPSGVHWAVDANPLSGILQGFRWSLLGHGAVPDHLVAYSSGAALLSLAIGVWVFAAMERDVADVV